MKIAMWPSGVSFHFYYTFPPRPEVTEKVFPVTSEKRQKSPEVNVRSDFEVVSCMKNDRLNVLQQMSEKNVQP